MSRQYTLKSISTLTALGILCSITSVEHAVAEEKSKSGTPEPVIVEPGVPTNVDTSTWLKYVLHPNSVLNVNAASVRAIDATLATVNINGGVVDDGFMPVPVGSAALLLNGSRLTANNARIISASGIALRVLGIGGGGTALGSNATIINSFISGVGFGVQVGESTLSLARTEVIGSRGSQGDGTGIDANGSRITINDSSLIKGDDIGMRIKAASSLPGEGIVPNNPSYIDVDHSVIQGLAGPAIKLVGLRGQGAIADITLKNDTSLLAGNGNLVEVYDSSKLDLKVDDSRLTGNLFAQDGSTLDVVMSNGAELTGNVFNVNTMGINAGARWQLMGDSDVNTLTLERGRVSFAGDGFNTLSLNELAGNGTFDMRINLDNGTGDLLNVNGQAFGHHQLNVQNTGTEAVPETFDALRIVHTEGGDAEFGLVGGKADLGVYSYGLERQGDDWFVVSAGKVISPSTQSALALFNAGPTIWNSELTTLRSRMGEIRGQEQGGGWIRAYGNRFNASLDSGLDYRQKQQGMSFGADAPVAVGAGQLSVGLMGGFSKSDLDMSRGTSGEVNSYYIGGYGTWLSDEGYYVDAALKLNKFHNESKVAMSDGARAKGNYTNGAVGGTLEVGKHIKLSDDYFVEPYAQLSSVWIAGDRYTLDNGLEAKTGRTRSVLGKLGTTAGRNFTLEDGSVLQPYVRVAMAQEFARSNDVEVNETRFDNSLFGSRTELGAGVSVALSKRLELHADFDYMKGKHVEQPWGANVGLKVAF